MKNVKAERIDHDTYHLLEDMFGETGSTVINNATHFSLEYVMNGTIHIIWEKSTGILVYYYGEIQMGGGGVATLEFHLVDSEELPPTTTSTGTAPAIIPGYEVVYILPVLFMLVALNLRRRKD